MSAQPPDDVGNRREHRRRAVTQTRLAQRHQDEKVLRRLVHGEGGQRSVQLCGGGGRCYRVQKGMLRGENQEARSTPFRRYDHPGELERYRHSQPPRGDLDVFSAALRVLDRICPVVRQIADQPVVLMRPDATGQP